MGMALAQRAETRDQQVCQLVAGLRERPELGIARGLSAEIYYACRSREDVREQLCYWRETAVRHRLPLRTGQRLVVG